MKPEAIEERLRHHISEQLDFFAVFAVPLYDSEILHYLPVKTSLVAVRSHLKDMEELGLVYRRRDGRYGLRHVNYINYKNQCDNRDRLLATARRWGRIIGLIPSVKAVVASDSLAWPSATPKSNINLIIVTTPSRLYITKALVHYLLSAIHMRAHKTDQAGRFTLGWFYTTAGLRFVEDIGPEPYRSLWLARAVALYGEEVWENLLYRNSYINTRLPNFPWKHRENQIYAPLMASLEYVDDLGYRRHLSHVAGQQKYRADGALLRIRPDVIIQAAGMGTHLARIKEKMVEIQKKK